MKEILGQKLGMTRIFKETGESLPVTVIEAGPCPVVAIRTKEKNGYESYQVGFGAANKRHVNKPTAGHFSRSGVEPTRYLREVRFDDTELKVGDQIRVNTFAVGDRVDVSGVSRGLGFAGAMKRHHFHGANTTHGQSDRWRAPGSVGSSSYPSRVFRGQRMASRMGRENVTVLNLEVVKIIEDENLILVKGAVPGTRGTLVKLRTTNRGKNGL